MCVDNVGVGVYIETFGCQMNVSDSEVVASLLRDAGYRLLQHPEHAHVHLINTCAIRENAELRVLARLRALRSQPKVPLLGVLGCVATHRRGSLLEGEGAADFVLGPDSYRDIPDLLTALLRGGEGSDARRLNVRLSREETYADVVPYRYLTPGVSAFTSIMRGCNKRCSYCVVPFTRGQERSRPPQAILAEIDGLRENGIGEVTLLGQNVNSYLWPHAEFGFEKIDFPALLGLVAERIPSVRIRFSTSHPKDLSDSLLEVMASFPNICSHIHLPVQSGSDTMLARMRRGYTSAHYIDRVEAIRAAIPGCGLSTDLIAGFCGETEKEHCETLELMERVRFDAAFMFKYSDREGTLAHRTMEDNVPEEVKTQRLQEIITLQGAHSLASNQGDVGREFEVLVEGESKRSASDYCGRTQQYKMVVFPKKDAQIGTLRRVRVLSCTSSTLLATLVD